MLVENPRMSQGGGLAATAEALNGQARIADISPARKTEQPRQSGRRSFPGLGGRAAIETTPVSNRSVGVLAGVVDEARSSMFMTGADARTAVTRLLDSPEHRATRALREYATARPELPFGPQTFTDHLVDRVSAQIDRTAQSQGITAESAGRQVFDTRSSASLLEVRQLLTLAAQQPEQTPATEALQVAADEVQLRTRRADQQASARRRFSAEEKLLRDPHLDARALAGEVTGDELAAIIAKKVQDAESQPGIIRSTDNYTRGETEPRMAIWGDQLRRTVSRRAHEDGIPTTVMIDASVTVPDDLGPDIKLVPFAPDAKADIVATTLSADNPDPVGAVDSLVNDRVSDGGDLVVEIPNDLSTLLSTEFGVERPDRRFDILGSTTNTVYAAVRKVPVGAAA